MVPPTVAWMLLIGAVILVSLVMWLVGGMEVARRGLEVIRKRFFCPGRGQEVEVDFLARVGDPESLLRVESCSAFKAGEEMDCDRSCLHLPQAQMAPPLP